MTWFEYSIDFAAPKKFGPCVIIGFRIWSDLEIMTDEAEMEPDLDEERDNLRDELTILSGDLKKLGYDFTDTVRPLLIDTAPATAENNQRLKRRYDNMKGKLDNIRKQTAPPPPPSRPTFQPSHHQRASSQRNDDDDDDDDDDHDHHDGVAVKEVLPRYGFKLFPRFCELKQDTYEQAEKTALWAFHVITSNLATHAQRPQWMQDNWNCQGPTTHGPTLLSPPYDFTRYTYFTKNGYISAPALFRAARNRDLTAIEIGRTRAKQAFMSTTGNESQQRFKRWAIQQVVTHMEARPDVRMSQDVLLGIFYARPEDERTGITPYRPEHYFKKRPGFKLSMDELYASALAEAEAEARSGSAAVASDAAAADHSDIRVSTTAGPSSSSSGGRGRGRGHGHGRGRGR